MSYLVLDLETTVRNTSTQSDFVVGDFAANPHHPDNKIVMVGYKHGNNHTTDPASITYQESFCDFDWCDKKYKSVLSHTPIIVGQNIAFDLLYLYKESPNFKKMMETSTIWDIQIAEYVLTGQQTHYASLQDMIVKYGGTLKPDWPKEQWDKGIQTEDMDWMKLSEYCQNDVEQTENIFLHQYQQALDNDQVDLIMMLNEAKLATIEMEHNGIFVNVGKLHDQQEQLEEEIHELTMSLIDKLVDDLAIPARLLYSCTGNFLNSDKVLSTILFGGTYKVKETEQILDSDGKPMKFKSGLKKGQVKTRIQLVDYEYTGLFLESTANAHSKKLKTGNWQINEQVVRSLIVLAKDAEMPNTQSLLEKYLEYTDKEKTLSTYVKPFLANAWYDDLIHPTFNHATTNTGRLSSSKPNFQNITNKG